MTSSQRLPVSLLLLRLSVFVVMFIWTLDKLLRPDHMASVFERYYGIGGLGSNAAYAIGGAELLLILAFVSGMWKRWTYGAVLLLHAVSTAASFSKYVAPFEAHNLLFFAAWPMLAACIALYLLRDADTLFSVSPGAGRVGFLFDDTPSPLGPLGPVDAPEPPESAPGAARIAELLQGLAAPEFGDREEAEAELTRLARRVPGVLEAIIQAIDGTRDPEALARIGRILRTLSADEAEQYAEQARVLLGNVMVIRRRFPTGSELENEGQADFEEAVEDLKAAQQDLRRSGVDARRRRAMAREKRFEERKRKLNPLADFFGPN